MNKAATARSEAGASVSGPPPLARPRAAGLSALPLRVVEALGAGKVVLGGVLLALLLVAGAVAFAVYERHRQLQAELQRSELLAHVLEDQASLSIETASLALAALADVVASGAIEGDARLGPALHNVLAGLPVLRSLAVLDTQGQVLASTVPGEAGLMLYLRRLGPLPGQGAEALGTPVAGRGLAALAPGTAPQADARGEGRAFLPLLRGVVGSGGRQRLLLAVIDVEGLGRRLQRLLQDPARLALLTSADGTVWATSDAAVAAVGQRLPAWPSDVPRGPAPQAASYVGAGARPGEQLVAWRGSATRAMVLRVDLPLAEALRPWQSLLRWLAGGTLLVLAAHALMTAATARSLRARAAAQRQRNEAQAEVAQRERELSVIVKSVQGLLFRTDAGGRLVFVNAHWPVASGEPESRALGRRFADLVQPGSAAAAAALFDAAGPGGVRAARLAIGPADAPRQFDVVVVPLLGAAGLVGFAGSAMDVTEPQRTQSRLQAQLAFTELMLEVVPLPLVVLDREGRLASVNQAWEAFTGRRREQVLGRRPEEAVSSPDALRQSAHDAELSARGGSVRFECSLTHVDGSRRDVSVTKAVVPGEGGAPAGFVLAFIDVSEFREAERATRAARDLAEDASRAKTEFVANISHELRTPLQSIIGFSELGMMRAGPQQQRLGSMFGDIHAAGQRMLALVNDLLDVAKIESTVGTFHLERTDVRALVRDVVGELAPLLDARRLRVDLQISEGPLTAKVDPVRFQQVVRNVLANAIRFSPVGESLVVAGDIGPDHRIHLSVRDHGPGIPQAELEKIFEAFVQSSKTKNGSGGTGLGLAICRKIVQAHGGDIFAENNADGGATFHIRLPSRGFGQTTTGV